MNLDWTLVPLEAAHAAAVLDIATAQFGVGYLSSVQLERHYTLPDAFGQVILANEQVLGFSLMEIQPRAALSERFPSISGWFSAYFGAYERLGYRSVTAVAPMAQGQGVGSTLVREGLRLLAEQVPVVVCDAWHAEHTPIVRVLTRHGYRLLRTVPHFWAHQSLDEGYQCTSCGAPPCRCTAGIYACFFEAVPSNYWWQRPDLEYQKQQLHWTGHPLLPLANRYQTPFYAYNIPRVLDNYNRLQTALLAQAIPFRIYYAMKANRHSSILTALKTQTKAGIDVCSPRELQRALSLGFESSQLTYTGTSLANSDLELVATYPHLALNLDALSAVRRFSPLVGKRAIGIRINVDLGMAYRESLEYSGQETVKFGIYEEQWSDLKTLTETSDLTVERVHCHVGSGFLSDQLERLPLIQARIERFLALFPHIRELNIGGGLGVPQEAGDVPLDLMHWASTWGAFCAKHQLQLAVEPGDYLVKDAGLLITQVNSLEYKRGELFVGIDAGMNVNYEVAYYQMNLEPVALKQPLDGQQLRGHLAGNINEPIDLLAKDRLLPPVAEGDYLALLNAGGYGASTSSDHCMRGDFDSYALYSPIPSSNSSDDARL